MDGYVPVAGTFGRKPNNFARDLIHSITYDKRQSYLIGSRSCYHRIFSLFPTFSIPLDRGCNSSCRCRAILNITTRTTSRLLDQRISHSLVFEDRKSKTLDMVTRRSKRLSIDDDDDDSNNQSSPNASETKELSIPKKPRTAQTIPKKSNDEKNGTTDQEGKIKKETPSLLSGMKKPPMPKANVSGGEKGAYGTARKAIKPTNLSRPVSDSSITSKQMPNPPSRTPSASLAPTPAQTNVDSTQGSGLRQLVFDSLKGLCNEIFEKAPIIHGSDLSASFLRHKDLNPTTFTSGVNEDGTNGLQYDFFDVDENTGNIVLQPKIPIFPEDFPAGSKEWPLSVSNQEVVSSSCS